MNHIKNIFNILCQKIIQAFRIENVSIVQIGLQAVQRFC